jgi:hypothetical protein
MHGLLESDLVKSTLSSLLTTFLVALLCQQFATATSIKVSNNPLNTPGAVITTFTPIDGEFRAGYDEGHVGIIFDSEQWANFDFASADNSLLVPGAYENARRWPFHFDTHSPGLDVTIGGGGENQLSGRFNVLDADYAAGGSINRFYADFELHGSAFGSLFGEVRYDKTDAAATPDQIRAATRISPADSQKLLEFRNAIPNEPTGVYLSGVPGNGGNQTLTFLPSNSSITLTAQEGRRPTIRVSNEDHNWTLRFDTPRLFPFSVGDWGNATRFPFHSPTRPGISVIGDGLDSDVTGFFHVLQAEFLPDGSVSRLDVLFKQHSNRQSVALFGRVRVNSTVPEPPSIFAACVAGSCIVIAVRKRRSTRAGCNARHGF